MPTKSTGMSYKIVPSGSDKMVGIHARSILDLKAILRENPLLTASDVVEFLEDCYRKINQ